MPFDDFRMQIWGEFISNLQYAYRITRRRDHVQQYDLGMKMASQECRLTNRIDSGLRNLDGKKNFVHEYVHFYMRSL